MNMLRFWKKELLCMGCLTLSSLAQGQVLRSASLQDVKCQELDAADLVTADPKIINFDQETQAYVVCLSKGALPSIEIVTAGLVPRFTADSELGLDDFQQLKDVQNSQDLFVDSAFDEHRVAIFEESLLPLSAMSADELLGPVKNQTVNQQVCTIKYETKKECTIQPKQVCKTVYGRTECHYENVEVCKDITVPVQHCVNKPTIEYYRELSSLTGRWKQKPAGYCGQGQLEKRTRVVYGRTIVEQRCCETKIVYGREQKVCGPWEAL